MSRAAVIAVDTMGCDGDVRAAVEGAAGVSLLSNTQMVLVGPEKRIQSVLDETSYNPEHIDIVDAGEKPIGVSEPPDRALAVSSRCSMAVATRLVGRGAADSIVSGGNVPALWQLCRRHLDLAPSVRLAAVGAVFPRHVLSQGADPLALILDVGATVRCDALDLVQFAQLGSGYVRCVSAVDRPRVGLLNMATRKGAGGEVLTEAYRLLERERAIEFVGNVEGHELVSGEADVVVCEGLLGNVVLKMLHGLATIAVDLTGAAARRNWRWRAGMAMLGSGVERRTPMVEYVAYAGAPILGFTRVPIYCDPISPPRALGNAIRLAAKVRRGLV
jgi:glycerol-3-phosphate acyltransferase PlsX